MKIMNLRTIALSVMAVGLLLTGCNKDENAGGGISETTQGVKIKFSHGAGTRAEGTAVAGGDPIELKTGHLFFASGNVITKYMTISASATDAGNLNITELESATGVTVENVPDNSTRIILMSNLPAGVTPATAISTPIETLKALKVPASGMGAADGGVGSVSLYGEGPIVNPDPSNPDEVREAEVEVKAMASRIEITKITGSGQIEDFKVAGIYINHYYTETSVDGVTGHTLVDHGNTTAQYENGASGGYNFTNGILHDDFSVSPYSGALTPASLVVSPAATNVWAYNLLPTTTGAVMPHIVLVLEDVKLTNAADPLTPIALSGKQYLTVKGFKEGATDITALEKGTIYKIANLEFTENEVTDQPEVKDFKVAVTLDLVDWDAKNVTATW